MTLTEQMAQADVTVIAEYKIAEMPAEDGSHFGNTVYVITKVQSNPSHSKFKPGDEIRLNRYQEGKPGDLAILTGTQISETAAQITQPFSTQPQDDFLWSSPLPITPEAVTYIDKLPSLEVNPIDRLEYFLSYLESKDPVVADDAYAEFAIAPYEQVVSLSPRIDSSKIRGYVTDPNTPVTRLGFYGLLLGLCGGPEDAALMEKMVAEKTGDFRIGIDGVMAGYLLLTGDRGLKVLEETKIKKQPEGQPEVPFSEIYAAMQALRFTWDYATEAQLPKLRVKEAMRLFLERPDMADLAVLDLARWNDWDVSDRLIAMYGKEDFDLPSVKKSIAGFFIQCQKAGADGGQGASPEAVAKAEAFLTRLETEDPQTLKHAMRLYR